MLNKKETISIVIAIAIITISISLIGSWQTFFYTLLSVFLVVALNILGKKAVAYYLDTNIEVKLWEIKRYWFREHDHFKKAFPAGIFLPIIVSALSFGNLMWLGSLVFEPKPKVHRAAKRHGIYSFSELTEYQIGLIAAAGVVMNLIFTIVAYFAGYPAFAKLNIWFAFFSLLPLSDLDGNKIFFGNLVMWSFLAIVTLIGVTYAFLLI